MERDQKTHDIYAWSENDGLLQLTICFMYNFPEDESLIAPFALMTPHSGFNAEGQISIQQPRTSMAKQPSIILRILTMTTSVPLKELVTQII